MRKNLHYKVLASVLAIAGLYFYNAPAAWADDLYGNGTAISIDGNKIVGQNIELQATDSVYGNYQDSGNANGANVTIKNKSNLDHVYGGFSDSANANNNVVNIDDSTSLRVFGGYAKGTENSNANENEVIVRNSTITGSSLYGGWSGYGSASNNTVIIENSIIENITTTNPDIWIIGGYAPHANDSTKYSATNNTVKLIDSTNVENADIYGGRTDNGNIDVTTGNKLILENWSGSVNSLNNFSDIYINNFKLNTNLINVGSVSGMKDVTIHLGAFTGDIALTAGDYAVGYNVKAAEIKWDSKLGSNIDFTTKDESGNDVQAFDQSLAKYNKFYIANRTGDGVYATKFNNTATSGENSVSITAEVYKSVLADKFIDENGQEHTNTQTQNRILTIGKDFKTNVGTVAGTYAAKKSDGTAQDATGGTVNISGNTDWSGTVYAGYSESGAVNGNKINVAANTKAQNMSLSGYNTSGSGNELNISGNGSTFKKIENFNTINFNDVALNTADAALTVASADVDGATIKVNSLEGGNNYKIGDSATLLKSANAITGTGNVTIANDIVTAGLIQDLHISTAQSADNTSIDLYMEDVSMNGQINLVAENRAVAAAFVNQGTDLISDSLDTLSRDGSYGVKTFAAVHGNRSKYDVNSDLKING